MWYCRLAERMRHDTDWAASTRSRLKRLAWRWRCLIRRSRRSVSKSAISPTTHVPSTTARWLPPWICQTDEACVVLLRRLRRAPAAAPLRCSARTQDRAAAGYAGERPVRDRGRLRVGHQLQPDAARALKSLDEWGNVVYTGSLSKSLLLELRIGYLVADRAFIREARSLCHHMLRHPPVNNQRCAALFLQRGHFDRFVGRLTAVYRERCDVMHVPGAALPGRVRETGVRRRHRLVAAARGGRRGDPAPAGRAGERVLRDRRVHVTSAASL